MRISDWSSDVCSSDLPTPHARRHSVWRSCQSPHKTLEQIKTVLRPRTRLWMILDAERPFPGDGDAAVRTVEQALMRLDHPDGPACSINRKAVVHAGELDESSEDRRVGRE